MVVVCAFPCILRLVLIRSAILVFAPPLARDLNRKHDQRGGQNWIRMIRYLTKAIGMNIRPSNNPKNNDKLALNIKQESTNILINGGNREDKKKEN